ncbi:MAG: metallophosphoesterase family protein [Chloroflexota bacterium]
MKIIVISDIHGNAYSLAYLLPELRREVADQIVCLGDAVQGGAQPAETVALLRELACPVVMGNADAWMLTGVETDGGTIPESRKQRLNAVRDWSLSQLSEDDRAFIAAFQPTVEIPLGDGRNLLCFHGSPTSFDDILLPSTPDADFDAQLAPYQPSILTGGHTHMQQIRRIGAGESFFFNPGSVGFAYTHYQPDGSFHADAWAEYAVLTVQNGRIGLEFRRVPYDAATLIEIYRSSGRPHADEALEQYQRA